jgi:ATP-dependent helicase/DNAse subunit B
MVDDVPKPNRSQRRAEAAKLRAEGGLDTTAFLKLADKFIDVANRENQRISATELHMAFLYAAARYNVHVAKVILDIPDHEAFVADMTKSYQEMLRQHLADPSITKAVD